MPEVEVNYIAVLAAAALSMGVGFAWYTLLAEPWMKAIGKKKDELGSSNVGYALTALAWLVMAYVLAHAIHYTSADTFAEGVMTGFWAWLGFVATTTAVNYIFGGRSRQLYAIDAAHFLAVLVAQGVILALWQ